ncbi:coiled-coil domain-containing protein 166-like [Zootoca vivipara]|uniref:coiled-coil domain-containing protein 166-like n=1 Tax=Zootoca vivipara TaxID=8524 RepID=UPI00293BC21B|nr:coiled-coil domain-containing protein 166-like [Zootoca vivipara]
MATKRTKSKSRKSIAKSLSMTGPLLTEQEQTLKKESVILAEHIHTYTERVEQFQSRNELLDKEAQEIRLNSKAYQSYLNRRAVRCQDFITTLNDQNLFDLATVLKQKEELTSQYTDKETEMRSQLIEMETKFSLMTKEVEELKPFKELQTEQLSRIRELEKELLAMKIQHSEQMRLLKSKYLHQKAEYEVQADQKVQALAKKAEKEAVRSLIQHTNRVKEENRQLRNELLGLIQRAKGLKAVRQQLREQKEQLLRELQYGKGLAHKRRWLQEQGAQKTGPTPSSQPPKSGQNASRGASAQGPAKRDAQAASAEGLPPLWSPKSSPKQKVMPTSSQQS